MSEATPRAAPLKGAEEKRPIKRLYADDILFGDNGQCKLKLGAPLFASTESRFAPRAPADGGNKDAVDAGPGDVLIVLLRHATLSHWQPARARRVVA